ncbi:exopolysaccharide biosynthesis protein [Nitrospirillum sp. BR 11164]|uniref:exopolysaccharide biosynthesis protein n=1 Tax=Nitrospirillum sp. BR 11164 TaxID=3104324 RepID=UPI002AFE62ED|nr:exopolysaccharide biosynthesis protein [Nitrospirillum sp. BR 11164]MEA1649815.1 exopolysaccharide biosynthesis protein [Nitrospirillum sp. BR 11164]
MTVGDAPNTHAANTHAADIHAADAPRPHKVSDILQALAADEGRERVAIGDLLTALSDRAVGALIFVFAVPNALPMPPGTSAVLGLPLVFLTAQLALGRKPWLPRFISSRSLARKDFAAMMAKVAPWLAKAERMLKPRLGALARPPAERAVGLVCFLLALVLFLPIPLGNMLPAVAISLVALGVLERDGVWVLLGLGTAAASVAIVWGVLVALLKSGLFLLEHTLGI